MTAALDDVPRVVRERNTHRGQLPVFCVRQFGKLWLDGRGRRRSWSSRQAAVDAVVEEVAECDDCGIQWRRADLHVRHDERGEVGVCTGCAAGYEPEAPEAPRRRPPPEPEADRADLRERAWAMIRADRDTTFGEVAEAFGVSAYEAVRIVHGGGR